MSQTLKNDEKKNLPFSAYISVLGLKKTLKMLKHIYTFAQNLDKLHLFKLSN